jgi:hypothetical protein
MVGGIGAREFGGEYIDLIGKTIVDVLGLHCAILVLITLKKN